MWMGTAVLSTDASGTQCRSVRLLAVPRGSIGVHIDGLGSTSPARGEAELLRQKAFRDHALQQDARPEHRTIAP